MMVGWRKTASNHPQPYRSCRAARRTWRTNSECVSQVINGAETPTRGEAAADGLMGYKPRPSKVVGSALILRSVAEGGASRRMPRTGAVCASGCALRGRFAAPRASSVGLHPIANERGEHEAELISRCRLMPCARFVALMALSSAVAVASLYAVLHLSADDDGPATPTDSAGGYHFPGSRISQLPRTCVEKPWNAAKTISFLRAHGCAESIGIALAGLLSPKASNSKGLSHDHLPGRCPSSSSALPGI
jgi:hypothetical protein